MSKRLPALLLLAGLCAGAGAQEIVPSGFGTIGYAQSNRDYAYERFVDRGGSFDRDSVLGLQLDARLGTQWFATLQLKAAPALDSDSSWAVRPTWAFIGFRPSNDWLLRAGRFRAPLYMYSESLDVGVTHDMVRLPTEMYSLAPSTDFDGLSIGRTWARGESEWSVDAYHGRIETPARLWSRDGLPPAVQPGAQFTRVEVRSTGLVVALRQPTGQWRASWHRTSTRQTAGTPLPVSYPLVTSPFGFSYYQVDASIPGPGFPTVGRIRNDVFTIGVEQQLPQGWRVAAEFARNIQHDTELGSNTRGGYVAVFKELGRFTPYVALGTLKSASGQLEWYRRLTGNPVPAVIPGADLLNGAQRLAAEGNYTVDQRSLAIGASFAIAPQHKLKLEWKRTRIGQVSRLVDTPSGGGDIRDTDIDIWSMNYNVAF